MACVSPRFVWASNEKTQFGSYIPTFSWKKSLNFLKGEKKYVCLPCGKCVGCRSAYARDWSLRCIHEAQLHKNNCFVTLTIAPEHYPADGSVRIRDIQLFMKRLRKKFGKGVRYFACGEYGEKKGRAHYHLLLFNMKFPDMQFYKKTNSGSKIFTSKILSELWPFGWATIGELTINSASYVARYTLKKGSWPDAFYEGKSREFITMSRRKGIGFGWIVKYFMDIYGRLKDCVHHDGKTYRPPRYYDRYMEKFHLDVYSEIKKARLEKNGSTWTWKENKEKLTGIELVNSDTGEVYSHFETIPVLINDTTKEEFNFTALKSKAVNLMQRCFKYVRDFEQPVNQLSLI